MGGVVLASDNFCELNVKAGLNLNTEMKSKKEKSDEKIKPCPSVNVEYLINARCFSPNLDFLKGGLGLSYLLPTELDVKNPGDSKFSYLPIYFTLQFNPLVRVGDERFKGIFVKGNIGYNAYFSSGIKNTIPAEHNVDVKEEGGLYYSMGAGYEFPFGAIVELTYSEYDSSIKINDKSDDITYSCVGLNIGYKFKI
jgi:hypothetical protein